jgi:hypothetical protein
MPKKKIASTAIKPKETFIEAKKRLCANCKDGWNWYIDDGEHNSCGHELKPICADGSDCPYFEKKTETDNNA